MFFVREKKVHSVKPFKVVNSIHTPSGKFGMFCVNENKASHSHIHTQELDENIQNINFATKTNGNFDICIKIIMQKTKSKILLMVFA